MFPLLPPHFYSVSSPSTFPLSFSLFKEKFINMYNNKIGSRRRAIIVSTNTQDEDEGEWKEDGTINLCRVMIANTFDQSIAVCVCFFS